MGEILYNPACVTCRREAGKDDAKVTRECHDHLVLRLIRERDEALVRVKELETENWTIYENAKGRIDKAERERDEARLLLEKWDKDYEGVCDERDEARAELASTRADLHLGLKTNATMQDENDRLRALLREVRRYVVATAEMDYYEPNAANATTAREVLGRLDAALEGRDG